MIEFTPKELVNGTLYIQAGDEYIKEIAIETVEKHQCSGTEWMIGIPATTDYTGYAVMLCDICGDICDMRDVAKCEKHSFGEFITEVFPTENTCGLKYQECSVCGNREYVFVPSEIDDTISPASITYDEDENLIVVSSSKSATLYIATYEDDRLVAIEKHAISEGMVDEVFDFASNQVAYVWDENLRALCRKFTIGTRTR